METVKIDFEPCKSIGDIQNLLKEHLIISEWDDKNPDVLLRQLKELNQCEIYLRGTNLLPNNISEYMKQIISIFNKVEEMYNNIDVNIMDVVTIDFTGVKSVYEAHKLISEKLDFPDWYGGNLPALWDLLYREIPTYEVHMKGTEAVSDNLLPFMKQVIEIFRRAETDNSVKLILE